MNPLEQPTPAIAPTPRTDAIAIRGASTAFPRASYFVDSDFARTLESELAAAKAECERFRLFTLKQDGELTRLRAQEIDYVKMIAEVLKCETRSACEQPDNRLEAPWDVIARLRAENLQISEEWNESTAAYVKMRDRAERAEAELAAERARLDWVFRNCKVTADDYTTGNRDVYAIHDREDLGAAMKEDAQ